SLPAYIFKQLTIVSLSAPDQWSEHTDFLPLEFLKYILNDLFLTKLHHYFSGVVTVGLCSARKKKTHKIIHFGNGSDRGSGISIGGFLFYRDDWGKSGYLINIRPLHVADKLPRVCRKTLHI